MDRTLANRTLGYQQCSCASIQKPHRRLQITTTDTHTVGKIFPEKVLRALIAYHGRHHGIAKRPSDSRPGVLTFCMKVRKGLGMCDRGRLFPV